MECYRATFPEMGVVFRRDENKEELKQGMSLDCLVAFADADLAGDIKTSRSTMGYSVHLGNSGMFEWKVKTVKTISQSSCESETVTNKECVTTMLWLRCALAFMTFKFEHPTPVAQDNTSAIATCTNEKHHSRTRHFRMQIHFVKDCFERRITCHPWVPTKWMKGDLFNKGHGPARHEELLEMNQITPFSIDAISEIPKDHRIYGWEKVVEAEKKARLVAEEKAKKDG
jgi:hypothetical protein